MITEKKFCIYCKKELNSNIENSNQYHLECLKEIEEYQSSKRVIEYKGSNIIVEEADCLNILDMKGINFSFNQENDHVHSLELSLSNNDIDFSIILDLLELKNLVISGSSQTLNVSDLPNETKMHPKLTSLTINNCTIQNWKNFINYFPNIENFSINSASLTELPFSFDDFKNLKSITISNNKNILFIPITIYQLGRLESLNFSNNSIDILRKEISNLRNLRSLDLTSNYITNIPKEMGYLKNIRKLFFDDNFIKEIPEVIYDLKNIEILSLKGNPIKKLSKRILELENLQKLTIDSKYIDSEFHYLIKNLKENGIQISETGKRIYV